MTNFQKKIFLVTGVAGYIGATFAYEALLKGHKVFGIDNFANSTNKNIIILKEKFPDNFSFFEHDLSNNLEGLIDSYKECDIGFVVHFAGLKAVNESEDDPAKYWENNIFSTINLIKFMEHYQIKNIVFSSSATVYGDTKQQPVKESFPVSPMTCYGKTKAVSEEILKDFARLGILNLIVLRYFNPVASHKDMEIIEDIAGNPSNIMPNILRTALKIQKKFLLMGNDYSSEDGTCIRDFIHISDLVDGHFAAIDKLASSSDNKSVINLGTGKGISLKKLLDTFSTVNNIDLPIEVIGRRDGDIEISYASVENAKLILGWQSKRSLDEICKDSWESVKAIRSSHDV